MSPGFNTSLAARLVDPDAYDGRGLWELTAPLAYTSVLTGKTYVVPVGFQTDFASVPRVPIAFLLCGDSASPAAALHDWLYATHEEPDRAVADALLREAALACGVPAWRSWLLHAGVRLGGASHWG